MFAVPRRRPPIPRDCGTPRDLRRCLRRGCAASGDSQNYGITVTRTPFPFGFDATPQKGKDGRANRIRPSRRITRKDQILLFRGLMAGETGFEQRLVAVGFAVFELT